MKWQAGLGGGMMAFSGLNVLAVEWGHLQAEHPMAAGFAVGCEGVETICWQGIVPGVTGISEARRVIEAMGYAAHNEGLELADRVFAYRHDTLSPGCIELYYRDKRGRVDTLVLGCIEMRLGDVMVMDSLPTSRSGLPLTGESLRLPSQLVLQMVAGWVESPFHPVRSLQPSVETEARYLNPAGGWYGFMPEWLYCLREPTYGLCPT